ncbi:MULTISPECIES: hypothetical protein [Chelativorans]|jgi:hypothetical protein|nr:MULTISPECIES: hypothetical protein [Chelativorans]
MNQQEQREVKDAASVVASVQTNCATETPSQIITVARSSLMSWFGILGGVLTIFSNLQGILDLARWAHWLAGVWTTYAVGFWRAIFGVFGIRTDADATMMICMAAFVTMIALGARVENDVLTSDREEWPISFRRAANWRVAAATAIYLLLSLTTYYLYFIPWLADAYIHDPIFISAVAKTIYITAIVIGLQGWPTKLSIFVALSFAALSHVFTYGPMRDAIEPNISEGLSAALALGFAVVSGLSVVILAPPRAFCRRLMFVIAGVAILIGLSELSTLGLSVSAPPVS